jgi:acetyl esterase
MSGGGDDYAPGMDEVLAAEARLAGADRETVGAFWAEGAPEVAGVEELTLPGASGQDQPARLYRGTTGAPAPVALYIHGGGWIGGGLALNEHSCRSLVAESGWSLLAVTYRLAPAHPFPAGLEDCAAALDWLRDNAAGLGLDAGRIAFAGTSAGANLALALALERPGIARGLLLHYGVYDRDFGRGSFARYGDGPGLTAQRVREIFAAYAPKTGTDPRVTPLHAPDLSALPPACLIAAERDVLADENAAMAVRLREAGVETEFHIEPGVHHGFINRGRLLPAARACLARGGAFLRRLT